MVTGDGLQIPETESTDMKEQTADVLRQIDA